MEEAIHNGYLGLAWHLHVHPDHLHRLHKLPDSVIVGAVKTLGVLEKTPRQHLVDSIQRWDPQDAVVPEKTRLLAAVQSDESSLKASVNFAKYQYLQKKKVETRDVVPQDYYPAYDADGIWTEIPYRGADDSSIQSGWTVSVENARVVNRVKNSSTFGNDSTAVAAAQGPAGLDGGLVGGIDGGLGGGPGGGLGGGLDGTAPRRPEGARGVFATDRFVPIDAQSRGAGRPEAVASPAAAVESQEGKAEPRPEGDWNGGAGGVW